MPSRLALSIGNFFSGGQYFLVLPTLAPFLATVIPAAYVGFVIAASAALTLIVFPFVPALVRSFGSKRLLLLSTTIATIVLAGMAFVPGILFSVLFVLLYFGVQPFIAYFYDLLLEATVSTEGETGQVRTLFITACNAALVLSALVLGLLLGETNAYSFVFIGAALLFIPLIISLLSTKLPEGEPPHISYILEVCRCIFRDADLRAVSIAMLTLQFFYHLAPFFIPLYLHTILGIPWSDLGWMFAIMLLPFLLLEYPVGWLADRVWGDQELMALGFFIIGSTFAALAFTSTLTPLITLAIVLLLTRIGAAVSEATIESHFFRRVSEKDANSVGVFRMLRPVGALIAPLFGSLVLFASSYAMLFFVSGLLILVFGVSSALSIRDVR